MKNGTSLRAIFRRAAALTLCCALTLGTAASAAGSEAKIVSAQSEILVSLTYQTGVRQSADFTANGFLLGYYDAQDNFVETGQISGSFVRLTYYASGSILVQTSAGRYSETTDAELVLRAADGGTIGYGSYTYSGELVIRQGSGGMEILNRLPLDDYVAGVLPYEMVATWPIETLKAGAVAARTYAASSVKHQEDGFDVCDSTCCQVYHGVYTESGAALVERAAAETAGICAYYNGELIEALYHASDGGATEDSENVWSTTVPYLRGKADPYDQCSDNPYTGWSYSFSAQELTQMLRDSGEDCATVVAVEITGWTQTGNVAEVTFTDAAGKTYVFSKDAVRSIFRKSSKVTVFSRSFSILAPGESGSAASGGSASVITGSGVVTRPVGAVLTADGTSLVAGTVTAITRRGTQEVNLGGTTAASTGVNNSSEWIVSGSGYGHHVGMSQWGAYNMGQQGFTYEEILKFYYTGITVE